MLENGLEMLIGITIAYFSGAFILTVFFYYLYFLNKQLYLKKFVLAWLMLSFAYEVLFFALYFDIAFLYGLYSLLIVSYSYLFLSASALFLEFNRPRFTKFVLVLAYFAIGLLTILTYWVAWSIVLAFMTASMFLLIGGLEFFKKEDILSKVTGSTIIVFAIVSFFYPFLATQSWVLPWGYIILGMLGLFMGMSLIQVHFQTQKEDFLTLQNKLEYMVYHDPLTDIHNRLFMNEAFDQIESDNLIHIGLLFIDLNNFKQVNDTLGHRKGDDILVEVTRILETLVKDKGVICRFGGDEFIVILYNSTPEQTHHYKNTIIDYGKSNAIGDIELDFAVGASFKHSADQNIYSLLEQAESSMYSNKEKQKKSLTE